MSPTSATLTPGATRQFSAIGWINGSSSPAPNTTWSATGGTISSTGLYKAGNTPGTYQVKVVSLPTWHSETATITISGTAQPSATISAIALSP
ncbi:MAG TPA: hypothetical protein VG817_08890, partial [Gemmatimonadales bacterium]|nr:hypothetical protein [Gemmatimonadales bacterium]